MAGCVGTRVCFGHLLMGRKSSAERGLRYPEHPSRDGLISAASLERLVNEKLFHLTKRWERLRE